MRHSLEVQAPTRARDAVNALTNTWVTVPTYGTVRGHVRAASAFERSAYAHDVGGVSHVVTIRSPGFTITKRHRLKWGDRVLEIRGVVPDDLGRFVRITCEETVTGGGGEDGE